LELFTNLGAELSYHDPFIPRLKRVRKHDFSHLESRPLTADFLAVQDCVVVATNHSSFDIKLIVENSSLVVDTRNATRDVHTGREKIVKA
jgi:UDP-N-acetyl-D-glucosamine dehydrogenase